MYPAKLPYLLHLGAGVFEPFEHGENLLDGHVGSWRVVVDLLEVTVGLVLHLGEVNNHINIHMTTSLSRTHTDAICPSRVSTLHQHW